VRRAGFILLIVLAGSGSVLFADEIEKVRLMVGRSITVDTGSPIARVSLTSSDVADALVTSTDQLLIQGKMPGTISMFVWNRAGAIRRYDVTVERDLSRLATQVRELFPGEPITVDGNGKSIVVSGLVTSKYIADKAVEVAAGYVDKKDDVVNLLQVREAGPAQQVLLRVRFAEVSRNAMTELGVSLFTGPNGYKDYVGRSTTQQFAAPTFDNSGSGTELVFSDFLNLFLFNVKNQLGGVVKALQAKGLFQSLAEPNLVAESGKEASFLAGGEFPIPIAQGSGANIGVSVVFKEFGIRLTFTPTVVGDRVRLKVKPEVSAIDFSNAVTLAGFRVPALTTRRTETEIELQNGQTFAIAGLLSNTMESTMNKIPGIGDIPILGYLFRSKAAKKGQSELVVMITPQILPRNSTGVTAELPRLIEPYLAPVAPPKTFPSPPPAFSPSRSGDETTAAQRQPAASPAPTAAEAAAVMSALSPRGPTFVPPPASVAAPAPDVTRPLTADEKKVLEKAHKEENEHRQQEIRAAEDQARRDAKQAKLDAEQAKLDAKEAELQKRKDEKEKERQEKLALEQARREAKAAAKAAASQAELEKKNIP
jgi:pilus assembly protein CpaC